MQFIYARSSMDRMKDSGSFDAGSTPAGGTALSEISQLIAYCWLIRIVT